jgi:hypothetical protein
MSALGNGFLFGADDISATAAPLTFRETAKSHLLAIACGEC